MKSKFRALLSLLLSFALAGATRAHSQHQAPDVPLTLQVPAGYRVSYHAYAVGVQIYRAMPSPADPTKLVWTFTGPEAVLYDGDGVIMGFHYAYAGPTQPAWESESGSLVVGTRTIPPVAVDPTAIPWLLLDATHTEGPGIFKRTTHIQRINTTGGLAPATAPTSVGEVARVFYTAEYYFYRAEAN